MSAPVADKVTAVPAQVVALPAATCGSVFTSIVMVWLMLIQPCDSPTAVYVVWAVGLTTAVFVVVWAGLVMV